MKHEIIKGTEKDFEGAPEWATMAVMFDGFGGRGIDFSDEMSEGARVFYSRSKKETEIVFPRNWEIIAERRPITEPFWDGEGLPPVGLECELKSEEYADYDWVKVRVVFEHNGELIAIVNMPDEPIHDRMSKHSSGYDAAKFRPIRSPEDVARDVATKAFNDIGVMNLIHARQIYDAIAAGKIPGVKLV